MTRDKNQSAARPMVAFAALIGLLTLAGCGSSAPTSTAGSDTTTQPDAPAASSEASAPAGDGDGLEIGDFCLITAEEVSAAFEVEGVVAIPSELPGVGGACLYNDADGLGFFGIAVITTGGDASYSGAAQVEGSEELSGIGDEAIYQPAEFMADGEGFAILFKKGNVVVNIGPSSFEMLDGNHERLRAATEELARTAAGRL